MKKQQRKVKVKRGNDQWKIQQLFGNLAERLDRLPDAGEVQRNPLRSAPPELTTMVF
jgi:hypothetical protein